MPLTLAPHTTLAGRRPCRALARPASLAGFALLFLFTTAQAQAPGQAPVLSCSSDGQRPAPALLERFMDADCSRCWQASAPPAARGVIALDWVAPSARGEDAAMSAVALTEAQDRLQAFGLDLARAEAGAMVSRQTRTQARQPLRLVQGFVVGGYLGGKLSYRPSGSKPYTAWLLLVEQLPAGTEGSGTDRQLVRAAAELRPPTRQGRPQAIDEIRAFRLPEGAQPERLRLVGWVQDTQGRLLSLMQTHCPAP